MLKVCYRVLYSFEIVHILCNKSLYLHHTAIVFFMTSIGREIACLFGVFCPTRDFLTHLETSPLPVKGSKF